MGRYDSSVVKGLVSRNLRINKQLNPEQDLFYFFSKKNKNRPELERNRRLEQE